MTLINNHIRRVVDRMQLRFARSRPGSVLILVVVLLVLMALLGTSFLATSRNDRAASKVYEVNVEIDMLVEGVKNAALSAMSDTSYQQSTAQRYDDWWSHPITPADTTIDHSWMAARYPVSGSDGAGFVSTTGQPRFAVPQGAVVTNGAGTPLFMSLVDGNTTPTSTLGKWVAVSGTSATSTAPFWPAVTGPLVTGAVFEDPRVVPSTLNPIPGRFYVSPSSVTLNGQNMPAMKYIDSGGNLAGPFLAASASGDGIADSFLWRIPIGTIDGVTYYGAVRVIDNNAAINFNTANSSTIQFNGLGSPINATPASQTWMWNTLSGQNAPIWLPGIFPSDIGLAEITFSGKSITSVSTLTDTSPAFAELKALNDYRINFVGHPPGVAGGAGNPLDETPPSASPPGPIKRTDIQYRNISEALYMGLGRRVGNPGYVSLAGLQYQPLLADGSDTALAYRFDLVNPNIAPTLIEKCLSYSLYNRSVMPAWNSALNSTSSPFNYTPYDPTQTVPWFSLFTNVLTAGNSSMRPYLTARNPLSNAMPAHDLSSLGLTTGLNSQMVDLFPVANPTKGPLAGPYVSISSNPIMTPKVSLNTAPVLGNETDPPTGPSLWLGFYNAMLDALVNISKANGSPLDPIPQAVSVTPVPLPLQFRSPLRDPSGMGIKGASTYLSAGQTILLRALLAAVNAADLRDSDENITMRAVPFRVTKPNLVDQPATLIAFGTEKQPFITEVYANTEVDAPDNLSPTRPNQTFWTKSKHNPQGYVAVQIYNPYDKQLVLQNWTLGVATRTKTGFGTYTLTVAPITGFGGFNLTMPARSYAVLESSEAQYRPMTTYVNVQNGPPPPGAQYLVGSAMLGNQVVPVPNLTDVIAGNPNNAGGGELILFRPVIAGTAIPSAQFHDALIGGALAPVDSFDFTNLKEASLIAATNAGTKRYTAIHYVRSSPGTNPPAQPTPYVPTSAAYGNATTPTVPAQWGTATNTPPAVFPANSPNLDQMAQRWKFVYPGRWDPAIPYTAFPAPDGNYIAYDSLANPLGFTPMQEGIAWTTWDASLPAADVRSYDLGQSLTSNPFGSTTATYPSPYAIKVIFNVPATGTPTPNVPTAAGYSAPASLSTPALFTATAKTIPSYSSYSNPFPPIQVCNTDFGGPAKLTNGVSPNQNMYPFGAFARIGDVLQVPYFGGYIIKDTANNLIEINSVTRDCALCDDFDANIAGRPFTSLFGGVDDPIEQVGRFCPLLTTEQTGVLPTYSTNQIETTVPLSANDTYGWASHIFDCFNTLTNPNDDYLPNLNPATYLTTGNASPIPIQNLPKTASVKTPNSPAEDSAYQEGLININTADWRTLATIPWVPANAFSTLPGINTSGAFQPYISYGLQANQTVAQSIVKYRNTYGPFKTLMDLNKVGILASTGPTLVNFQSIWGDPRTMEHYPMSGALSPDPSSAVPWDGVCNDFQSRYAALTRVSNLLTTRSDSYTVYILVQGWTGAGTSAAQVVAQRRLAFIVDRSQLSATNRSIYLNPVPTN